MDFCLDPVEGDEEVLAVFDPAENTSDHLRRCRNASCLLCEALRTKNKVQDQLPILHPSSGLRIEDIKDSKNPLARSQGSPSE